MSTSFYAIRKLTREQKKDVLHMIADDDVLGLKDVLSNIESVEVGQRAGGWKFLWNPFNKFLKSLSKDGITEFVNRDDIIICDEYRTPWSAGEFLDMAFTWCPDGYDLNKYYEEHPDESRWYAGVKQYEAADKLKKFGITMNVFKNESQGDFMRDGLRWTIF